jgi:uncharacterized membrane protein
LTLSDWADIARIVTSIASVLVLAASATAAVLVYRWQRKLARIEATRKLNDDNRAYNLLVIENEDLQSLDAQRHRWGQLENSDVKKMFSYFILVNISYNLYEAYLNNAVDKNVYRSQLDNCANTTYLEKDFVLQHVFPRGYKEGFCNEIKERWEAISKDGTLSKLYG